MWNHVVMEQAMRSFPIGKKYNCEEEWWHMGESKMSQKQKDQWRSYVSAKLDEDKIKNEEARKEKRKQ